MNNRPQARSGSGERSWELGRAGDPQLLIRVFKYVEPAQNENGMCLVIKLETILFP